jgi:hypothetical protein
MLTLTDSKSTLNVTKFNFGTPHYFFVIMAGDGLAANTAGVPATNGVTKMFIYFGHSRCALVVPLPPPQL